MIQRQIYNNILHQPRGKAIIIIGPRQVGKTTLIRKILEDKTVLFVDGDDPAARDLLSNINTQQLKNLIGDNDYVFIDECQRFDNIGVTAKIIVDQIKTTQLIMSGSSSYEINDKIAEPLTGRKWTYNLYPISYSEWDTYLGRMAAIQDLNNRLVFGFYPEILTNESTKHELLEEITESYLFKDIFTYSTIRKSEVLNKLVKALALQVGSEVSYNELSNLVGIDSKTVINYIDILEKAFVVFRLNSFNTNQRTELKKGVKIYFYDNGIRNAVINNFNPVDQRTDVGQLWENFLIADRRKQLAYEKSKVKAYFWRSFQQQEVDYIEELDGKMAAYEFKWNAKKTAKLPTTFSKVYDSTFEVINPSNYFGFLLPNNQ